MENPKKHFFNLSIITFLIVVFSSCIYPAHAQEKWPDGTAISKWFYENQVRTLSSLGKQYVITDHGVKMDSSVVQTKQIQAIIDKVSKTGGGVVVIPSGTFLTASLFFKKDTHLHLEEGAELKGSDNITDYPVVDTRIEGQNIKYFPALVNADGVDGFTISGSGTLNGNGKRFWKSFWLRRKWNPNCTNLDEMRPRILFVSNSNNVQVSGIKLKDSPFWSSHYYKCKDVKLLNLRITAPQSPVKAPSSDAVDIDVCENFHIKNCYFAVNDDAISLKGGKGPKADKDENNGINKNVLIEDTEFGFVHSALTCGSESIHNYNILFRKNVLTDPETYHLLNLKMRPDTPQHYEYITVEDIKGVAKSLIYVKPWTQFYDLKGENVQPISYASNITLRNIDFVCNNVFDIKSSDRYVLSNFNFENWTVQGKKELTLPVGFIKNMKVKKVEVNGQNLTAK